MIPDTEESPMPKITYYGLIDEEDHPPERSNGIVRRIHTEPFPTDEAFTRNMKWEPTAFLILHEMGREERGYVEISQELAEALISHWRSMYSKGLTPDSPDWMESED
jgi:hypothetical protein